MTATGFAGCAAIFLSSGIYCLAHGLLFGDAVPVAVSAGWAGAMTLAWSALLLAGWMNRERLRRAANRPGRGLAALFALIIGLVLVADAVAMQVAALLWGEPFDFGAVLPGMYGFAPHAATLSAILLLSLLLWDRHQASSGATAFDGAWLDFPEVPLLRLRVEDVRLIRSAGNYSEIVCAEGTWLVRAPIGDLAMRLRPRGFVRIHRQSIVNAVHVRAITRDGAGRPAIRLACGEMVTVGRSYRPVLDALTNG